MEPTDITVEILKQIRDATLETRNEVVATRVDLGARIDAVRTDLGARIDAVRTDLGARIDAVDTTLLELAEQQRFVVRHFHTLAHRDRKIETEVDDLRSRVDAIEGRLGPR